MLQVKVMISSQMYRIGNISVVLNGTDSERLENRIETQGLAFLGNMISNFVIKSMAIQKGPTRILRSKNNLCFYNIKTC